MPFPDCHTCHPPAELSVVQSLICRPCWSELQQACCYSYRTTALIIPFSMLSPMSSPIPSDALYSELLAMFGALCNRNAVAIIITGSEQDHVWPVVEVLHHNPAACQPVAPPGMTLLASSLKQFPCCLVIAYHCLPVQTCMCLSVCLSISSKFTGLLVQG